MSSWSIRPLRYVLLSAGAVFGIVVTLRALFGPLWLLVPVNRPVNVESFCGLAFAILVALAAISAERAAPGAWAPRARHWAAASVFLLAVAAFWPSLHDPPLADDYYLLRFANTFSWEGFDALCTTGRANGFFRPLPNLLAAALARVVSYSTAGWHLTSFLLHAANSVLVFYVALYLGLARSAAWLGAVLFAIHGTRPEAVVWTASRYDLVATLFVLGGLVLFQRYRAASGWRRAIWASLTAVSMLLGMLSKESAFVFPLLVLWLVLSEGAFRSNRWLLAILFLLTAAAFAFRWSLLGGIGGYTSVITGRPGALSFNLVPVLNALLLRVWAALCFPVNWSVEPSAWLGLAIGINAASLLWLTRTRAAFAKLAFPLGFIVLAALPPVQLLLIGSDLQKTRLLYLPSIGFCLLIAGAWGGLAKRERIPVALLLLVFQYSALHHNLAIWKGVAAKAERSCAVAANCVRPGAGRLMVYGLPNSLDGVYFLVNGLADCVLRTVGHPVEVTQPPVPAQPPPAASEACWAVWDPAAASLRCVP